MEKKDTHKICKILEYLFNGNQIEISNIKYAYFFKDQRVDIDHDDEELLILENGLFMQSTRVRYNIDGIKQEKYKTWLKYSDNITIIFKLLKDMTEQEYVKLCADISLKKILIKRR